MKLAKYIDDFFFLLTNPRLVRWIPHGLQIQPNRAYRAPWLHDLAIDTILDIGANVGQAAINFCSLFPSAYVHSFEPIPACFAKLEYVANVFKNLSAYNYAIGDKTGEVPFNQNAYSPASSILRMSDEHRRSYPKTNQSKEIHVPVRRLDDVASELNLSGNILIKIDVQGYERNVIAGGVDTFNKARIVIIETAIKSLYEGDSSFHEIYQTLTNFGYAYYGSLEQLVDPKTGVILQQDAIFVKQ
ncbi:FkbM family methyltransferase [Spirosoma montaniterrae]|uniref:Methyltransferase FkbM domain-containing protein n=1 Tax=Spirosoma montaniterrae TaxID=1178516 RepID=A0A1P9X1T8_9BACT|nr:FkbM family methyltransferase [Spirosoma montaniterrae]AQG81587.1 hypothetical protein AWR27_21110 [Spirosoma montaniterrae]